MHLQVAFLLRLVVAGVCGVMIGYERKNRMKEAGIRTHFVVAVGAALMMIVSKYGFQDEIGHDSMAIDPSRIAAQVVSGVSFLGAGMIFLQKQTVKGLTTAAGIWATAGMGLAVGSGLYWVGLGVTVIILAGQMLLHGRVRWLVSPKFEHIMIRVADEQGILDEIQKTFAERNVAILGFHAEKNESTMSEIELSLDVKLPGNYGKDRLLMLIQAIPAVKSVEMR
ncbi:MgtC/SapB family protein [Paenibacillus sp. TAB 01]|uniref:MgtC/SapB family protein n=1 Tax=Paenibacillus sp. TAB 01 TaxID=3368988 RepID=UPI0037520E92